MYRAYVKSQEANGRHTSECEEDGVNSFAREKVKRVWDVIEEQCKSTRKKELKSESETSTTSSRTGWEIVRVFVSSTFADFFNEREVLVKRVFPELREWCKSRCLKLIECDLRWGVPKDSSTSETIMICLEEIDKCINANHSKPFFVTLLGDRYGWIPPISDVPSKAKTDYNWVEGTSITCMEILHGAYRNKNSNAGFFQRNSSVYKDIPENKRFRFVDEDPLNRHHVQELKERIKSAFPSQVFDYEVSYKQLSTKAGKERVELTDFDGFANSVLDFLKSSISKMYPEFSCEELDPVTREAETWWSHVLDQASNLIGRQKELQILLEYLSTGSCEKFEKTIGSSSGIRQKNEWDVAEDDQPICVLEAPGGWGKTTLLCSVIKQAVQNGWNVFYHIIVGSTSSSNHVESLLKRLILGLNSKSSDIEKEVSESSNLSALKNLLRKSLADFRAKPSENLIVLLDGLNVLDNSETIQHLSWLPPSLPSNIRCIVSTNQHLPTLSRLYEHSTLKMTLPAMTQSELSEIASIYFKTFSKILDSHQLDSFISKTKVNNPLWLILMAEELRIFGDFALIDQRISEFPSSMDELLIQIIDRLIAEDQEQGLVKKVLCLIACSTYGLPADKARQICGNPKAKEEVAQLYWLQTFRLLRPYLRISGFLGETITFSHEAVEQAVYKHLLAKESDIRHWHSVLADFYQYWCDDGRMKVFHLPKHLKRAFLPQRIVEFMRKDRDSYFFISPWQRSHLLWEARCRSLSDPVIPGTAPMMLCHSCAMQCRSFNVACTWSNQRCCVICSQLCQGAKIAKAYTCSMHSNRRGKDLVKCVLCNFVVNTKITSGPAAPFPANLCSHCAFGNGEKTCAALKC